MTRGKKSHTRLEIDRGNGKDQECSSYTFVGLATSKRADDVYSVIVELLKDDTAIIKMATYGNGDEFTHYDIFNPLLGMTSYFAHPYHSPEGTPNENINGIRRKHHPH